MSRLLAGVSGRGYERPSDDDLLTGTFATLGGWILWKLEQARKREC